MEQVHGLCIPHVVETEGRGTAVRIRRVTRPLWIRCRNYVHNTNHRLDYVVDVGKVPLHVPIVEDIDRLTLENRLGKLEHHHVRTAPRTVYRKEPQARRRQAEQIRVAVRHELISPLRGAVHGQRMIGTPPD